MNLDTFHPGYFLPTVAGGLVAAGGAAQVGQHRLAQTMFGLGIICWVIFGSVIMGRLLFRPLVPPALLPTYAIEGAPAAVSSLVAKWGSRDRARVHSFASFPPQERIFAFGPAASASLISPLRL